MIVMRRGFDVSTASLRCLLVCAVLLGGAPTRAFGQLGSGLVQERDRQQREQETQERQMRGRFNRLRAAPVSAEAGTEPDGSGYGSKASEPRRYWVDLAGDNYGPEIIGDLRGGANLGVTNLLGLGDSLAFGAIAAERYTSAYASYEVPITPYDTRLAISFDYATSELRVSVPEFRSAPRFSIDNESLFGNLQVSHPLVVSPRWLVRSFIEAGRRDDSQSVSGVDVAEADLTSVYGGISGDWIDNWGSTSFIHRFGHVFRHHLDGADFYKYRGSVLRYQPLHRLIWATVRMQGQLTSSDQLWQSELISAGGGFSVRGYPELYRTGHDGYLTQIQLNAAWPGEIRIATGHSAQFGGFLFFDHAALFTGFHRAIPDPRAAGAAFFVRETVGTYLAGAGGGVNVSWNDYVALQVAVGVPMSERDNISDARVHFAINFTPPVNSWIDG